MFLIENDSFLQTTLGPARAHAAALLGSIGVELSPDGHRSLTRRQGELEAEFRSVLPLVCSTLSEALREEAAAEEEEGAWQCLQAAVALFRLGWTLRPVSGHRNMPSSDDAPEQLNKLLGAVGGCLRPRPGSARLACAALEAVGEVCERQEATVGALFRIPELQAAHPSRDIDAMDVSALTGLGLQEMLAWIAKRLPES